jgi:signal transduction histidine kinase
MSTEAEPRSSLPVSDFLLVLALAAGCYLAVHGAWLLPVLQHTSTGVVVLAERPPFTRLDDAVPGVGVVHELAGAAFLLIAIFDFLTGVINGWNDWMRRRLGLYITFINAASLYNYYSLWSGTIPLVYDHLNRAFAPTRLVHWTFTSTLMVGMMGALGNAPFPRIANALFVQFTCLSCGFLFHYLWQPWCYVAFLFNFSCFVLTLRSMWNFLTLALKSALTEEDERVIVTFRVATVCVWSVFAIMIFGKLRLVSHLTEEIVLVIADFLSKGLVSLTLYHLNTISPDRLELVYLLMQQNIIVDPETVAKTKRSIESLQRIVDAAFSETPIHDRDTLALLRQLRDADQHTTDETDLNSETDKVAIASRKVLFDFKRKFLTRMRAEFKTPLNHIIAASNSVLHLTPLANAGPVTASTPVTGERRDALLHVMASAQSLLMDVDNMLEFVNFQAQQMQLPGPSMATNVEFSLVALLDSVYDFALQRGADQWGRVELLISRHPHCPTLLIGDPYRMFLVLRN